MKSQTNGTGKQIHHPNTNQTNNIQQNLIQQPTDPHRIDTPQLQQAETSPH